MAHRIEKLCYSDPIMALLLARTNYSALSRALYTYRVEKREGVEHLERCVKRALLHVWSAQLAVNLRIDWAVKRHIAKKRSAFL